MSQFLIVFALACVIWGVASSLLIVAALQKRGYSVNWLWLRLFIFKYLHQYRQVTRSETGRVGPLFYSYVISMNLALVAVVAYVILNHW